MLGVFELLFCKDFFFNEFAFAKKREFLRAELAIVINSNVVASFVFIRMMACFVGYQNPEISYAKW